MTEPTPFGAPTEQREPAQELVVHRVLRRVGIVHLVVLPCTLFAGYYLPRLVPGNSPHVISGVMVLVLIVTAVLHFVTRSPKRLAQRSDSGAGEPMPLPDAQIKKLFGVSPDSQAHRDLEVDPQLINAGGSRHGRGSRRDAARYSVSCWRTALW